MSDHTGGGSNSPSMGPISPCVGWNGLPHPESFSYCVVKILKNLAKNMLLTNKVALWATNKQQE